MKHIITGYIPTRSVLPFLSPYQMTTEQLPLSASKDHKPQQPWPLQPLPAQRASMTESYPTTNTPKLPPIKEGSGEEHGNTATVAQRKAAALRGKKSDSDSAG